MKLEGRVAIVTGAGRNIGEEVAHSLAREGARVAVVDSHEGRARAVADAINKEHREAAVPAVCDVSSSADVERLVAQVVDRWRRIDILVNNAAVTDHKSVLDLDEEEWDLVLSVTLKSVFLMTKYVARHMVQRGGGGKVINTASTSGYRGRPDAVAYAAAKGGVLNLTRALAVQLAPHNIRVNSVTPNRIGSPVGSDVVPTEMRGKNLVGRLGQPRDIAVAVVFLASDDADFITGIDLPVDGGVLSFMPG